MKIVTSHLCRNKNKFEMQQQLFYHRKVKVSTVAQRAEMSKSAEIAGLRGDNEKEPKSSDFGSLKNYFYSASAASALASSIIFC